MTELIRSVLALTLAVRDNRVRHAHDRTPRKGTDTVPEPVTRGAEGDRRAEQP